MTHRILWAIPLGALVVAALAGCSHAGAGDLARAEDKAAKPLVQVSEAAVQRGTVRTVLPVTGTLSPLPDHESKVAPMYPGRIAQFYVKTGDTVAKDQVLAKLESGPLLGQLQQSEAAVSSAEATLQQARLNLEAQKSSQSSAVALARSNLQSQQIALDKLLAGSRPQEIAQSQASVTAAQAGLAEAQTALARTRTLYGEGLMARKDLDAAKTAATTAAAQVQSAQEALSMAKQGNRPQDIEAGRIAVQQAKDQIRAAQEQSLVTASKTEDVKIAERQIRGAQGALSAVRTQIAALTVRAPVAGTVVGRTLNPGEAVDATSTIATIADLDRVMLLLGVPLAQIGEVHRGQVVEFTVESNPGNVHRAIITVVGKAVDPNTNTVQVEAVADNPAHDLRDDGYVRGSIVTAVRRDALVIPPSALVAKDGGQTVFVVGADSAAHARPVRTGLRDDKRVQVLSGLALGEHVVTTGAFELEDGTQVKVGR